MPPNMFLNKLITEFITDCYKIHSLHEEETTKQINNKISVPAKERKLLFLRQTRICTRHQNYPELCDNVANKIKKYPFRRAEAISHVQAGPNDKEWPTREMRKNPNSCIIHRAAKKQNRERKGKLYGILLLRR